MPFITGAAAPPPGAVESEPDDLAEAVILLDDDGITGGRQSGDGGGGPDCGSGFGSAGGNPRVSGQFCECHIAAAGLFLQLEHGEILCGGAEGESEGGLFATGG